MACEYDNMALAKILGEYTRPGLYLILDNGTPMDLSFDAIKAASAQLEHDTGMIPPDRRTATEFAPCPVCPNRGKAVMCHALPAILPFLDSLTPYHSYDRIFALFVESDPDDRNSIYHLTHTTFQRALQYMAMHSVLTFCETGRLYAGYFSGVIPFSKAEAIAERVYANVMLAHNGDAELVSSTLESMRQNLMVVMQCQTKRVRLVSRSDVFLNAFVNLHIALEMLKPEERRHVRETIAQKTPIPITTGSASH